MSECLYWHLFCFLPWLGQKPGREQEVIWAGEGGAGSYPNKGQLETIQKVSITTDHWSRIVPLLCGRVMSAVITLESKMVTPWCSLYGSLPPMTPSWNCQVCRVIQPEVQFPHKKIDTFMTCVQRARWSPRATSVSVAGFQPILLIESPFSSALSACLLFLSFHPNLNSLSAALMQKETHDYLRRKRSKNT